MARYLLPERSRSAANARAVVRDQLVATSAKLTQHTVAQTFLRFQVALVQAAEIANCNRVEKAIVTLKSKVTSCAMLSSPECVSCKPR